MDLLSYIVVRAFLGALNCLPLAMRISLLTSLIRLVLVFLPKYTAIGLKNLEIAFPESDLAWRRKTLNKSYQNLARIIVDFSRLSSLDETWIREHVECPFLDRYREIKRMRPETGVVVAAGHLGSFELLAHSIAKFGHPFSFVVRDFKLKRLDRWWRGVRESQGNRVISRTGAFKEIAQRLSSGEDVALLFDQNVRLAHAVFVDFFGVSAATTKAVALAALRNGAPLIVSSIAYLGQERYRINAVECDLQGISNDSSLSTDDKVFKITQIATKHFEQMVREFPEGWFWLHRRWKTRPEGQPEDLYK